MTSRIPPTLIGFTGKKGSGKDTAATFFCVNYDFVNMKFADPMKRVANQLFGWKLSSFEDQKWKETVDLSWGFSPRKVLQLLGTEFGRNLDPNLWVKMMEYRLKALNDSCPNVVISDVRFENEAAMIRKRKGIVVHLDSSKRQNSPYSNEEYHMSEKGIEFQEIFDRKVDSNSNKEDLKTELITLACSLGFSEPISF